MTGGRFHGWPRLRCRIPWCTLLHLVCAGCATTDEPVSSPSSSSIPAVPLASVATEDPLTTWIPAEAEAVVIVEYARLRTKAWVQDMIMGDTDQRTKLAKVRGYSEVDDVDRAVTVALPGGPDGNGDNLQIYRGRFDPDRLAEAWKARFPRAATTRFRDRDVATSGDGLAWVLGDDRTLITGALPLVREALDSHARALPDVTQQAWWHTAHAAADELWREPAPTLVEVRVHVTDAIRTRLRTELGEGASLLWFNLRAGGANEFQAAFVGETATDGEASDLVARMRGLLATVRARPIAQVLALDQTLDAVRLRGRDRRVIITLHLTASTWQDLQVRLAQMNETLKAQPTPRPPPRLAPE